MRRLGSLEVKFTITQKELTEENVSITAVLLKDGMEPKVKVTDDAGAISKSEYTVSYANNSLSAVQSWLSGARSALRPTVTVAATGTNYTGSVEMTLPFYTADTKLGTQTVYVKITGDTTYTGEAVEPEIEVYFGDRSEIKKAKAGTDVSTLSLTELTEGTHYSVSYGANTTAGKNKGSITVTGISPYGKSVTVKFEIVQKQLAW